MSLNDPASGTVYFGGGASNAMGYSGTISRVFGGNWTEWSTINLNDLVLSGAIDEVSGFVYFGTIGGFVLKLAVSNFTIVDQIDLSLSSGGLRCGVIDRAGTIPSSRIYIFLSSQTYHYTTNHASYQHLR